MYLCISVSRLFWQASQTDGTEGHTVIPSEFRGAFANSGLPLYWGRDPPPPSCPIPIPFYGFSPSVLSQKFNVEQRVKVGPLTPFFCRMTLTRSAERYKLLCKMVKSFIRHQQPADQATDFLYLFFACWMSLLFPLLLCK